MKRILFIGFALTILTLAVRAQTHELKNNSVNGGGLQIESPSYKTTTTAGEGAVDTIGSSSYILKSGFQATLFVGSILPGTETEILSYGLPGLTGPAVINGTDHTITCEVYYGTDVTNLIANFTLSYGARAEVNGTTQTSSVTPNDFSTSVTYTITAGDDATTQDWIVTVNIASNDATDFLTYSIPAELTGAVISSTDHTIVVSMPTGTDVTNLVATFTLSPDATAVAGGTDQVSGTTANDFSSQVTYAVTAGDGLTTQDWTVIVDVASSTAADFLTFSFPQQAAASNINTINHTIAVSVPYYVDVTSLVASYSVSYGASVAITGTNQVSGTTANDFTSPVVYTVTAADMTTALDWTVTVTVLPSDANDILAFSFPEQTGNATINDTDFTVSIEVSYGTDVTSLVATFTLSDRATAAVNSTAQVSGTTANDFTNPVTYVITAEDGTTIQNWVVTVSVAGPPADTEKPRLTALTMPEEFPYSSSSVAASVKVTDNIGVDNVKIIFKAFEDGDWSNTDITSTTDTYDIDIPKADLGAMGGMQYYFKAWDAANNTDSTSLYSLVFKYSDSESPAIPSLTFGATVSKYQIISIPLELDDNSVTSVFSDLGSYNIKQWRLYHYDGSTKEYNHGFSTIEPGKGYWLIVRESKTIHVGAGKTVAVDNEGNYTIQLKPGHNQIGNPYNYNINWDDVISFNNNPDIGRVRLYVSSDSSLTEGNTIPAFKGGFVHLDGSANVNVKVPSHYSTSGRIAGGGVIDELSGNPLDAKNWALPITISNGHITNRLSAIGMHENSVLSKDRLDDILLPVPSGMCSYQLYFPHEEYWEPMFSRDFVPPAEMHSWNMVISSASPGEQIIFNWDNSNFGNNEKTLMLEDISNRNLVNLRETDHYIFRSTGNDSIRIYFGNSADLESVIFPKEFSLGNPYPNPFNEEVTIPFTIPDVDRAEVTISIISPMGKNITDLVRESYKGGYHTVTWNILNGDRRILNALYLVRLQVKSRDLHKIFTKRILLTNRK